MQKLTQLLHAAAILVALALLAYVIAFGKFRARGDAHAQGNSRLSRRRLSDVGIAPPKTVSRRRA